MPMNYAVRACNNPPTWSVSSVLCALLFSWYICNAYRFLFRTRIANQIAGRVLKIYFRWNGIGYVEGSRSRRVFSWSALHENNSRQIENTNYDDTDITWLAVPYCVKERAHTHTHEQVHAQHMRDFGISAHIIHNVNGIVIAIVIARAETCHKHSKRKHQLFS